MRQPEQRALAATGKVLRIWIGANNFAFCTWYNTPTLSKSTK